MTATGKITTIDRRQPSSTELRVTFSGRLDEFGLGDSVSLVKIPADKAIGRTFREIFDGAPRDEIDSLLAALTSEGWDEIGDLIKEIVR